MLKLLPPLADSRRWSLLSFCVLLLPLVIAIWGVQWFVTQDGPSHVYNAYIISESLKGNSLIRDFYIVNWTPLPNIAGHLLLAGLLQIVSAPVADRIMMTVTSVGLATCVVWLRWRVRGWQGLTLISPLALILASNVMWQLGFYNFLLGACLFSVTLGYWWVSREHMDLPRAAILAGLIVLGYLCHLVTSILMALGLVILSLATPGPRLLRRLIWISIILSPLVPLVGIYFRLMHMSGEVQPIWNNLPLDGWSLRAVSLYLETGNPLGSFSTRAFPFVDLTSVWFRFLHPSLWLAAGILLLVTSTFSRQTQDEETVDEYRGWIILGLALALVWLIAPNSFGAEHGEGLRWRIFLLALIAIIPALRLDSRYLHVWLGAAVLVVTAGLRSAIVWDCALISNRSVSQLAEARFLIGTGKRIGTLRVAKPSRCPSDALYHADSLLGIGTGNIVWNNYEAAKYYFPVKYRDPRGALLVEKFDKPVNASMPDALKIIDQWVRLVTEHHSAIDTFVIWGTHPSLDAMILQWYGPEPVFQRGDLRIFQHQ